MSTDGVNSILVIGEASVGKRFLVTRLLNSGAHAHTDAGAATVPAPALAPAAVLPHSHIETYHRAVDTKYYSATLAFHVLPAAAHAALSGDAPDSQTEPAAGAAVSAAAHAEFGALEPQAVVLLFDVHSAPSFHAVASRWETFIRDRNPAVMLCVANEIAKPQPVPVSEQQQRDRDDLEQLAKDWALDHGLEYVSLPHNDNAVSSHTSLGVAATGGSDGELDASGEPVGVSRVLEALECNMWDHIALKDRRAIRYMQGKDKAGSADADADAEDVDGDESQSAFADMQEEKQRDDAKEATAKEGEEDKFTKFVSAFPFLADSTVAAAPASAAATDAAAAAGPSNVTTSVPVTTSAAVSAAAPAAKSATATAGRSASASAFASGFMRAISTDSAAKPAAKKGAAAASAQTATAPVAPAPATSADAAVSLQAPLNPDEMDALSAQLLAAQSAAEASHRASNPSAADDGSDDAADRALENEMVAFDAVFEKIGNIKAEAARARDAQSGLSDAERRRRAEQTVMQLLKSMGMDDELDGLDDEEDEATEEAT